MFAGTTGPARRGRRGTRERTWARVVDDLGLEGHEWAVHVGAGGGSVARMLARRLPAGRVSAVVPDGAGRARPGAGRHVHHHPRAGGDAGPAPGAPALAVADARVEVVHADPRFLPFEYAGADVVVASLDRLGLPREIDRRQVLREVVRVVRHGRSVALVVAARDLDHTTGVLHELGTADIRAWRPSLGVFPALRVVTATRPPRDH